MFDTDFSKLKLECPGRPTVHFHHCSKLIEMAITNTYHLEMFSFEQACSLLGRNEIKRILCCSISISKILEGGNFLKIFLSLSRGFVYDAQRRKRENPAFKEFVKLTATKITINTAGQSKRADSS